MSFTPADMKTWPRAAEFRFFSMNAAMEISATVTVDVTHLREICRERNVKFTPVFLWLVTDCVNRQKEFRMGMKDDVPGFFDEIHPLFPAFHEDDKSISNLWVAYQPFPAFLAEYTRIVETYGDVRRFFARRDAFIPENTFVTSMIPWLNFTHFSAHRLGNTPHYTPLVEWGKFTETNGKTTLPVSFTVHHAAADGYHIAKFFEDLQAGCDTFNG